MIRRPIITQRLRAGMGINGRRADEFPGTGSVGCIHIYVGTYDAESA